MVFKIASDLIDSYLNKYEFVMLDDVELPLYEWNRVREYCLDNCCNNADLYALLANLYIYGFGVDVDFNLAQSYCETGIKNGSTNCIFTLGNMHYYGKGFTQSYENAIPYYIEASKKGLWRAHFKLGVCYFVPRGVVKDNDKAYKLFLKVAELGFAQAQFNVGHHLFNSYVQYDNEDCIFWFEEAAKQGHSSAMYYLGKIYENGYYVTKDLQLALSWYKKCANLNNISGLERIAYFFENGIILKQDYQRAYELYLKIANQGNADAKRKIREYQKNQCKQCGAFYTKTIVKGLFSEKNICSFCKKKYI